MRKSILAMGFACVALSMSAQRASDAAFSAGDLNDYNRLGVSYNNENYSPNDDMKDDMESMGLNGFGIDYIHGFHITESLPLFVETGLNFNYNFGSKDVESGGSKYTTKLQDMNFQVPVNVAWRFGVTDDLSIAPYLGLNFKLHLMTRQKYEGGGGESEWVDVFSDSKEDMGDKDATWNRFQMGWHVGVGFQYQPFYLGVQYGTDFIAAYSHDFDGGYKPKLNTGNLKVVLAYTF